LTGIVKQVLDQGAETTLSDCLRLEREALAQRKAKGAMSWQR
jgi:enoyl-CoA hydratase